MTEGDLTGIPEEQREAGDDQDVDSHEREDLQQEPVRDQEGQRRDNRDGEDRDHGAHPRGTDHTFSLPVPPKSPCGRTKRTASKTTSATASL